MIGIEGRTKVVKDDIIQLSPENPVFAGCLAIVTEVKPWGCEADVMIPAQGGPNVSPVRVDKEFIYKVGHVYWERV